MAEGVLGVGWLPLHRACVLTPGLSVPVPADPTPSKAMAVDELQWWPFPNRVLCLEKAEWLKTVPLLALPQREGLSLPGPASRAPKWLLLGPGRPGAALPHRVPPGRKAGSREMPGLSLGPLSQEAKRREGRAEASRQGLGGWPRRGRGGRARPGPWALPCARAARPPPRKR